MHFNVNKLTLPPPWPQVWILPSPMHPHSLPWRCPEQSDISAESKHHHLPSGTGHLGGLIREPSMAVALVIICPQIRRGQKPFVTDSCLVTGMKGAFPFQWDTHSPDTAIPVGTNWPPLQRDQR